MCHLKDIKQSYQYFLSNKLPIKKNYYIGKCEYYLGSEDKVYSLCPLNVIKVSKGAKIRNRYNQVPQSPLFC